MFVVSMSGEKLLMALFIKVAYRAVVVVVVVIVPDCIERIIKSSSNFFRILRK